MQIVIHCDGASRGNPGPAATAFCAYAGDKLLYENAEYVGITTNNVAEYKAAVMAYDWLISFSRDYYIAKVDFYFDSELVTKQLNGEYQIKSPLLIPLVLKIKQLEKSLLFPVFYHHVRRMYNKRPDELANQVLDSLMKNKSSSRLS